MVVFILRQHSRCLNIVRRERDDGKNRVLPNVASYNSDTCSAIFLNVRVCCICVFSYHVSTSYSVSLSPVVLTTSLPLFICCPENTVDSAFIASVRLEEWLLLLYGRERRCFFITFVHVLTYLNQPGPRCWVVKPYLRIVSPLLAVCSRAEGASFSTETLDSSYAERLRLALLQFSHCVAHVRWTEKRNTQTNQTPACSGGKSGPFDESVLSNSWFWWTSSKNDSVILSAYHVVPVCVLKNVTVVTIPVKLAGFPRQALLARKLVYKHIFFKPLIYLIWNNKNILFQTIFYSIILDSMKVFF